MQSVLIQQKHTHATHGATEEVTTQVPDHANPSPTPLPRRDQRAPHHVINFDGPDRAPATYSPSKEPTIGGPH